VWIPLLIDICSFSKLSNCLTLTYLFWLSWVTGPSALGIQHALHLQWSSLTFQPITIGCTIVPQCAAPQHVAVAPSCHGALLPDVLLSHCRTVVRCSPACCHCTVMLRCTAPQCATIMPLHHGVLPPDVLPSLRCDMGFLAFSFPRSLGSGVYSEINGGQRKLVCTYLSYISTNFWPIWTSSGARISKTLCQTYTHVPTGLAWCFAYVYTKTHPNRSKYGGDIAQISAHQFSLSSITFIINSTPQGPWERKGQKTHVMP